MTIFPDAGEAKEIAKLLLELADSPRDVSTTLDPSIGFVVPEWLYKKFVEVWDIRNSVDVDAFAKELRDELAADGKDVKELDNYLASRKLTDEALAALEAPETPARRKPGRPRKES